MPVTAHAATQAAGGRLPVRGDRWSLSRQRRTRRQHGHVPLRNSILGNDGTFLSNTPLPTTPPAKPHRSRPDSPERVPHRTREARSENPVPRTLTQNQQHRGSDHNLSQAPPHLSSIIRRPPLPLSYLSREPSAYRSEPAQFIQPPPGKLGPALHRAAR
jgi:hypothetical protein